MSPAATKSSIKLQFEPLVMKTKHPFGLSYGTTTEHTNILVKLEFEGLTGLGECAPASYHSENPATVAATLATIRDSNILGDNPFAIAEIVKRMDKLVAGNAAAKSGVEMALYDLIGKLVGQPLYKILGLDGLELPTNDYTIAIDSLDVIEKKTHEALQAGHKILKVKLGTTYDEDIIKQVRKVAKDTPLRVDANGGWEPKRAIRMAHFLAEHQVQFIEQPLPKFSHVEDFKLIKENSPIPIFSDETICKSFDVARMADAIDGVVVKLAKTGGILEALKVIHTARAHNLQVMFGMMIESSIGTTAAAHLSGLVDYIDLDGAMLLAEDPYEGMMSNEGKVTLPEGPGLGVTAR